MRFAFMALIVMLAGCESKEDCFDYCFWTPLLVHFSDELIDKREARCSVECGLTEDD